MEPQRRFPTNFDETPFLVIWETTRACALACVHCRADAIPGRDPRELTTDEGFALIDQVKALGTPPPLFVHAGLNAHLNGRGTVVVDVPSAERMKPINVLGENGIAVLDFEMERGQAWK